MINGDNQCTIFYNIFMPYRNDLLRYSTRNSTYVLLIPKLKDSLNVSVGNVPDLLCIVVCIDFEQRFHITL